MILVLDNGKKYKVNNKDKKLQILDIFYSSVVENWDTYVVMSEQQFILLKDLAIYYNLVSCTMNRQKTTLVRLFFYFYIKKQKFICIIHRIVSLNLKLLS